MRRLFAPAKRPADRTLLPFMPEEPEKGNSHLRRFDKQIDAPRGWLTAGLNRWVASIHADGFPAARGVRPSRPEKLPQNTGLRPIYSSYFPSVVPASPNWYTKLMACATLINRGLRTSAIALLFITIGAGCYDVHEIDEPDAGLTSGSGGTTGGATEGGSLKEGGSSVNLMDARVPMDSGYNDASVFRDGGVDGRGDGSGDGKLDGGSDASDGADDSGAGQACVCDAGVDVPCYRLAALYADDGKTAKCREDCLGYDVSGCSFDHSGMQVEYVYPAARDSRFADARCNDGTPFWFKVSLTGSRRWVVFFEGGGACEGALIPCQKRLTANPGLFSSKNDPADGAVQTWQGQGNAIMSRDATKNPTFSDANIAFANYCSSDLWAGIATKAVSGDVSFDLLFAGRTNARAVLRILMERYGFDDAKDLDIIVTGSSAGGNGARNNADLFATNFPKARKAHRIWVIPVAGFQIYQWSYAGAGVGGSDTPDPKAWDLGYQRWQAGLNPKCLALAKADGLGPGACFAGLYATRSLLLAAPDGYGLRVLDAANRTDPVYLNYHGVTPSRSDFTEILDAWEPIITGEMLASGLRWLLAPAHRGQPNLHGLYDVWTAPFPAYDAAGDPCDAPWPAEINNFRDLIDAFYADSQPAAGGVKVCIPDGWPP